MTQKSSYKKYPPEFKEEAVALVTEQGYTVPKAAEALGVTAKMLYSWRKNVEQKKTGVSVSEDERSELKKNFDMKINPANRKGDTKKGERLLCERNEVKFDFIKDNSGQYPDHSLCRVMRVSPSAYSCLTSTTLGLSAQVN